MVRASGSYPLCHPFNSDRRHQIHRGRKMKKYRWQIVLIVSLLFLSGLLYYVHYLLFRDPHHIFLYLVGDIAFIPVEVLIVTLIIHQLLSAHEKRSMIKKLNMVIGAFFSEVGTEMLGRFRQMEEGPSDNKTFVVGKGWTERDFNAAKRIAKHSCEGLKFDPKKGDISALKAFLVGKREFLLRLLENPNLLEHEEFTNLLWSVFHFTEELEKRKTLDGLPVTDYEHLAGDMKRVYAILLVTWLDYMAHLKSNYPYLFSLAVRTDPFDSDASVIVK